jgi:hypothetical protein
MRKNQSAALIPQMGGDAGFVAFSSLFGYQIGVDPRVR